MKRNLVFFFLFFLIMVFAADIAFCLPTTQPGLMAEAYLLYYGARILCIVVASIVGYLKLTKSKEK